MKIPNLLRKAGWGNYDRFCFCLKITPKKARNSRMMLLF